MAVVGETRRAVEEISSSPVKDATSQLVAKAAAVFGLPNLLLTPRLSPSSERRPRDSRGEEDSRGVVWESESRCSCTPLACLARSARTEQQQTPRSTVVERAAEDCKSSATGVGESVAGEAVENSGRSTSSQRDIDSSDRESEQENASNKLHSSGPHKPTNEGGSLIRNAGDAIPIEKKISKTVPLESSKRAPDRAQQTNSPPPDGAPRDKGAELTERVGVVSPPPRTLRKMADYEREWTFRPQLNLTSLRLVSRGSRNNLPVTHRLYEKKAKSLPRLQEEFTFSPKLNTASLRLAQERADHLPEVHARMSQVAAQRLSEACAHCTFHPALSQRSLRMARRMGQDRQQQHLLKRQKMIDEAQTSVVQEEQHKISRPTTLPTSPPHHTSTPSPHSHPHTTTSENHKNRTTRGRKLFSRTTNHSPSPSSSSSSSSGNRPRKSPAKTPQQELHTGRERRKSTPVKRLSISTPATPLPLSPTRRSLAACAAKNEPAVPEGPWGRLSDIDRVKRVKILGEQAIKKKKVFVCRGGYSTIRRCLRGRGWVEKEFKDTDSPYISSNTHNRRGKEGVASGCVRSRDSSHTHSDSSDDGDGVESEGHSGCGSDLEEPEYRMLCRAVRNADPNFVWTLRRDDSLYRNLIPSALANHFAKASSFTTKVGLCANLRNLMWCGETNSDLFFPRCFLLSRPEERDSFIDDYRLTTALNILKLVVDQYWGKYHSPNNTFQKPTKTDQPHTLGSISSPKNGTPGPPLKESGTPGPPLKESGTPGPPLKESGTPGPPLKESGTPGPHLKESGTPGPHLKESGTPGPHLKESGPLLKESGTTGPPLKESGIPGPPLKESGTPGPPLKESGTPGPHLKESGTPGPLLKESGTPGPPLKESVVLEGTVELALRVCAAYVSSRHHEDIEEGGKCLELTETEWKTLISHYYSIVLEGGRFACSTQTVRKTSAMLDELEKYLPQLHMDGVRNIWIVKPGAMSRGRGIVCVERLEPILELVSSPVHKEGRWVVQKYIERPLLIYGTKFDIRQWFLITDWAPLTVWMYKECYLRFATQRFRLDNMNESIHLCNNSIQRHYTNSGSRSELLPDENMWHSSTFREYLQSLGKEAQWDEVIYPGMKHALICAMQVSQDLVEGRKNSFELYGADFMLTDDLRPWLIEINCSPTMEPSTSVTSQLCAEVMKDTIRVVVDRRENKDANTGKFELAYKQPKFDTPAYVGIQLRVEGVTIQQNHTHHRSVPTLPVATLTYTKT